MSNGIRALVQFEPEGSKRRKISQMQVFYWTYSRSQFLIFPFSRLGTIRSSALSCAGIKGIVSPPLHIPWSCQVDDAKRQLSKKPKVSCAQLCVMDHEPREGESMENQTNEMGDLLICRVSYSDQGKWEPKRAYLALFYDLYIVDEKNLPQAPSNWDQFRSGLRFKLNKPKFIVSTETEDAIAGIRERNQNHSDFRASHALLVSRPAKSPNPLSPRSREVVIIFNDEKSRNRWYSAIKSRADPQYVRVNNALTDMSELARNLGTTSSDVSSVAQGVAAIAGTADKLASTLGGVAIVGPALNGVALLLFLVDRGLKMKEGQEKLPHMQSRLSEILKRLQYARKVLLDAIKPDGQNKQVHEIMKQVLTLFDQCSNVMGRVERQFMKSAWKQFFSVDKLKSIEEDLVELENKLDLTHIIHLVSECEQLKEGLGTLKNRVSALEEGLESDSFVVNYASVPDIPNGVVREAVVSYDKLKRSLTVRFPEDRKRSVAIWGMGGTGKSMACVILANDEEIRKCFCDGIHFIKLGCDLSEGKVLDKVADVVANSGGKKVAQDIRKALKAGELKGIDLVDEVMRLARNWMEGKKVLIVADNVWELRLVEILAKLAVAPESGFLFTTRNVEVAGFATENAQFKFSAFDTPGGRSTAILVFDSHLRSSVSCASQEYRTDIRDKLLEKVSGLPLAIASAAKLVAVCGWDDDVVSELEKFLREEDPHPKPAGNHPGLHAIMRTGLHFLDNPEKPAARELVRISNEEFAELKSKHGNQCFRVMYLALVLLSKENPSGPIKGVLSPLWGRLPDALTGKVARAMASISLGTISVEEEAAQLILHDLQYHYCEWACGRNGEKPAWEIRRDFLKTYCRNGQDIGDVDWVELTLEPLLSSNVGPAEWTVDSRTNISRMSVSLEPGRGYLAVHLDSILRSIARDSGCDRHVAAWALTTANEFSTKKHKRIRDLFSRCNRSLYPTHTKKKRKKASCKRIVIWLFVFVLMLSYFLIIPFLSRSPLGAGTSEL